MGLIKRSGTSFYCSNCRMRVQPQEDAFCSFCGEPFSNWEAIQIELYKELMIDEVKENESNLCK